MKSQKQENKQPIVLALQECIPNFIMVNKNSRFLYQKYCEMHDHNKGEHQTIKPDGCWIIDNQTGQIICE